MANEQTTLDDEALSRLFTGVQRPGRYIGGEVNSVVKPFGSVPFRFAFAFPDTYEIAMSHLGMQVLYGLVNSRPDALCERVFMPAPDMEASMCAAGAPLFTLESRHAVRDFDVVGFSLQYEICYATVLRMLDLAGIPRRREERRSGRFPLVIAGGPCAYDPEPLADFVDLFFIGDGEETLPAFIEVWKKEHPNGAAAVVSAAARSIDGLYAPEHYPLVGGRAAAAQGFPEIVKTAVVKDLDNAFFPVSPVIPFVEAVHERIALEITRGCVRGCRFCQAGTTRRPVRHRSVSKLLDIAATSYQNTGYDEISLLSLAAGDYPYLADLCRRLMHGFQRLGVGLSFPSLRADEALGEIAAIMAQVRKGAITVAAEAGSERLRKVINKDITEEGILAGLSRAFETGWNRVKMYFMVGLPSETIDDVAAIADLVEKVVAAGNKFRRNPQVTCSIAPFVPKPGTPFQWEPMASCDYVESARKLLFERLRGRQVKLDFHNVDRSFLEGALARGGRELCAVLERAADSGCSLDAWDDAFDYAKWRDAFASAGLDLEACACRRLDPDAPLAWSHISPGASAEFLRREHERAKAAPSPSTHL